MSESEQPMFNLLDAPMAYDRTAGWRYIRDAGSVFTSAGLWYITEPEAVRFALRNPELFSSAKAYDQHGAILPQIPINIDPPKHRAYRAILDPMLSPREVNRIEDSLREQVRDMIAQFAADGHCDVVSQVAQLYPTQVFLTLFGLPLSDRDRLIGWVEVLAKRGLTSSTPDDVQRAADELIDYLRGAIADKRRNPGPDILTSVLQLPADESLTEDEILGFCFLFCRAGLHTVTSAIGFVMLELARNTELRKRVTGDPSAIGPAVEEILRLELPVPFLPRVTSQDVECGGTIIPKDSQVRLCLATANRDTVRFGDPDPVDITNRAGHLAFGGGPHRCLGSHLARRELRLVVEEFHRMIPNYELAPGAQPAVIWPSGTLHLDSVPLVFPVPALAGSATEATE
jgi:cytochrome P450